MSRSGKAPIADPFNAKTKGKKPTPPAPGLAEMFRLQAIELDGVRSELRRARIAMIDLEDLVTLTKAYVVRAHGDEGAAESCDNVPYWSARFSEALQGLDVKQTKGTKT